MTSPQQWNNLIGLTAVDKDGGKIGKVGQVYLDDQTGQPVWVTVRTGLLGSRESFAPLYNSGVRDEQLVLAVPAQLVKDAPSLDTDEPLGEEEIGALYQHYAGYFEQERGAGQPSGEGRSGRYAEENATGEDSAAGEREVADPGTGDAMTRSEERLHVGTESVSAGRARLRKHVVTENVSTTVPVSHEEVRLEREPITDANRDDALAGTEISEAEHEVTLHAERPVVTKEAVPVERVRLGTETVTEEQEINEQVRKEQIDDPDVDQEAGSQDR